MKTIVTAICSILLLVLVPRAQATAEPQVFPTSAGPVKITPLNHASTLIEAGGKTIYLDPAKPVKFGALPKADLILITDIHGDHMDPDAIKDASKLDTEVFAAPAVAQTVTTAKPIANGETNLARLDHRGDPGLQPQAWSRARQAVSRQRTRQRLRPNLRR